MSNLNLLSLHLKLLALVLSLQALVEGVYLSYKPPVLAEEPLSHSGFSPAYTILRLH